MNAVSVIAASAKEAIQKIHAQMGPEAVVVKINRLPARGWQKLWKNSGGIEVIAVLPQAGEVLNLRDDEPASPAPAAHLAERESSEAAPSPRGDYAMGKYLQHRPEAGQTARFEPPIPTLAPQQLPGTSGREGRSAGALLEAMGIVPEYVSAITEKITEFNGGRNVTTLAEILQIAQKFLLRCWRPAASAQAEADGRPHIFVGPPGAGKTTALCKWMSQAALGRNETIKAWRLDSWIPHTDNLMEIYADILGIGVERFWPESMAQEHAGMVMVDLPGVNPFDPAEIAKMQKQISKFVQPHVHLVLNAAYETRTLLEMARAFEGLPIEDVVFTHLDQERRWGKLWNMVLGTNYSINYLSAGQKIPGGWLKASPQHFFSPELGRKTA